MINDNQPRRNEEREESSEKIFVLFVSSWLIVEGETYARRHVRGRGGDDQSISSFQLAAAADIQFDRG
jgi:hypothetical protein